MVLYDRRGDKDLNRGLVGHWPLNDLRRVFTDGIIAHFKLNDDAADTVVLDSKNGNHGVASVNTSTLSDTGKLNEAFSFNGTDEYITIPESSDYELQEHYTLSCWVNMVGSSATDEDIINSRTTEDHFLLKRNDDDRIQFFDWTGGGTTKQLNSDSPLSTGTWYHLCAVRDGTDLTLFIDGVAQADTETTSGTISYSDSTLVIGSNAIHGNFFFEGLIDDVRIYNRALSSSEVYHIYNNGSGNETTELFRPRLDGIIAQYKLNDNAANTTVVESVYGRDGTASANTSTLTTTGKINEAIAFNGANTNITLGMDLDEMPSTDFSFSAWISMSGTNEAYGRAISGGYAGSAGNYGWALADNTGATGSTKLNFVIRATDDSQANTSYDVGDNNFHHWCGVKEGNGVKLYVDGELVGSHSALSTPEFRRSIAMYLGGNPGTNFGGVIDDFRLYDGVLSANDIALIYNQGNGTETTEIIRDQVDDTIVARDLINFNDGTITGATTTSGINGLNPDAMNFDGVDDGVNVTWPVDDFLEPLTVNVWFKAETSGDGNIYYIVWRSDDEPAIRLTTGGNINFAAEGSGGTSVTGPAVNTGDWHMATVVHDGTNLIGYYDGEFVDSVVQALGTPNSARLRFGYDDSGVRWFDGTLQNIRYYNRALTDGEVKKLYRLKK